MRKFMLFSLAVVFVFAMAGFCLAATKTVGVQSSITKEGMNAKQSFGTFEVPANGKAYAFSGSASVLDANAMVSSHIFSIEKYDGPKNVVVFNRDFKGADTPVALANLVLGPGKYVLTVGGYPGSSAQISMTIAY